MSFKNPILEATYTIGTAGFNFGVLPVSAIPSVTCNNNNTCEAGESCNCGDCTNGGIDDKDRCSLDTNGTQMVCTKDVNNATIIPDIPYSKTITLSGTSGNNNGLFEKIATLPPGTYNFSGSGTSYNDGGGGTNMVFFSKKDIPNGWYPPAGWDEGIEFSKYGAATGACPEIVYYQ